MKRLDPNQIVERPVKTTRIHKRGNNSYVYHVVSSTYNPEKQYNTDSRICVGKMVSGSDIMMIPNEKFETYYPGISRKIKIIYPEPPVFCDTVKAGAFIVIRKILDDSGVKEILFDIYHDAKALDIINMITYVETAGSIAYQHYPAFMRDHLQLGNEIRSDSYLSRTLKAIMTDENINEFLRRWNKLHVSDDKIYVNFDGCNMNWEVSDSSIYAEYGAAKDDPTKPQANFMTSMDNKDGELLDYDTYNGSVVDMSQCSIMVDRMRDYGYTNVGCIFDRGFFRQPVIEWLDKSGYDVIMMADMNIVEVRKIILNNYEALHNQVETQLKGLDVLGITIRDTLWERERSFHLYYDDVEGSYQRRRFYEDILIMAEELDQLVGKKLRADANLIKYKPWFSLKIEEIRTVSEEKTDKPKKGRPRKEKPSTKVLASYEKRLDRIKEHAGLLGHFVIMSYESMNTDECLITYRHRDIIEKFFRSIKWYDDMNTPGVQSDDAFDARMHIIFLAGIVHTRLMKISRQIKEETKQKRLFTIPGIIDLLEGIQCTVNSNNLYKRRYAITAKQRLILEKLSLSDSDIDDAINAFNVELGRLSSVEIESSIGV